MFNAALLGLASQRFEYVLIEWFGTEWMQEMLEDWKRRERGSIPGPTELAIILYVFGISLVKKLMLVPKLFMRKRRDNCCAIPANFSQTTGF